MPRSKPKNRSYSWASSPYRLSDSARRDMAAQLWASPAAVKAARRKAELWLGFYFGATTAFSSLPRRHGRPQRDALRRLLRKLRKVFRQYYAGGHYRENRAKLTEAEYREVEFIEIALGDAGIQHPDNLRRLFSDSETALPGEHGIVLNRIAEAVQKTRRKTLESSENCSKT